MINFEQELSKFEAGLDREEVKKAIISDGSEGTSIQQNKLDQVMKRYGLALNYCKTDSYDLAYIQIQKVVRLFPQNLNVQLLAALISIHERKDDHAMEALEHAAEIDPNHPDIAKYKEEIEARNVILQEEENEQKDAADGGETETTEGENNADGTAKKSLKKSRMLKKGASADKNRQAKTKKVVVTGSDFEEVTNNKKSFAYIGIGFLIGIIAMMILVVPTLRSSAKDQYATEAAGYEDQLKAKETEISKLTEELKTAEDKTKEAQDEVDAYKNGNEALYNAADSYINGKNLDAAESLMEINTKILNTKASKNLYNAIKDKTYPDAAKSFYATGLNALNKGDYKEAQTNLVKAIKADDSNPYYHYYLARAYESDNKIEKAIDSYNEVVKIGTTFTTDSKNRIEKLEAEQKTEKTTEEATEKTTEEAN